MARVADLFVGIVGTRLLRKAKWSWLGYGMGAYVGLRLLRRYGIFMPQSDRAIRFMERNADRIAKRTPGFLH